MPGPEFSDTPPPEVPEEFAAAYRRAFREALGPGVEGPGEQPGLPVPVPVPASGRETVRGRLERWRGSRWFVASVAAVAAAVLVLGAYAVGWTFSGGDRTEAEGTMAPQSSRTTASSRSAEANHAQSSAKPAAVAPHGWRGTIEPVGVDAIAADCTAAPSTDSAGRAVTYSPQNAIDDKADTAWRCTGSGVGQKLVLRLYGDVPVGQVGLVPGYAKTDPASGADRYAENNRITRVRWTLDDGVQVVQRLDPDPSSRAMQVLRVPRTTTDTVVLEILAVQRGSRGTTAISTIGLWAAH